MQENPIWKKIKPSKKVLKLVIFVILIFVVIFVIKTKIYKKINVGNKGADLPEGNLTLSELSSNDTDKDGVADWEELLWGTNPDLFDTNNDGVSDGQYINSLKEAKRTGQTKDLNETELFSIDYFTTIMSLIESGNENIASLISNETWQEIFSSDRFSYEKKDIKIENISDLEYFSKIIPEINKYGTDNINPLEELNSYISDNDTSHIEKIKSFSDKIDSIKSTLIGTSTNNKYSEKHLLLINSLAWMSEDMENMTQVDTNSIVALRGLARYNSDIEIFRNIFSVLYTDLIQVTNAN